MKPIYLNIVLALCLTLVACQNQPKSSNHTELDYGSSKDNQVKLSEKLVDKGIVILPKKHFVPREFGFNMDTFFGRYLELEEALVRSDTAKANSAASTMLFLLNMLDKPMDKEVTARAWEEYNSAYRKNLKAFLNAKDLQKKRLYFSYISEYLYASFKSFDMKKEDIHLVYCPKAFNEKGAYWLTENHKIRNPYFGDEKLKCGQIVEVLPE